MNIWKRLKELFVDLPAAIVIMNPSKGIGLILRNCIQLDGRFSMERAKVELTHFTLFAFIIVSVPLFYIGSNIAAIWSVNKYIVPIPLVMKLFGSFQVNEESWETQIERDIAKMEDMSQKYDNWNSKNGVSTETSQVMQKMLWHSWPLYAGVAFFIAITFYLIVVRFCISVIKDYHRELIRRKMAYFDKDLRIIPRNKIL